jgi:hypothetical protein
MRRFRVHGRDKAVFVTRRADLALIAPKGIVMLKIGTTVFARTLLFVPLGSGGQRLSAADSGRVCLGL